MQSNFEVNCKDPKGVGFSFSQRIQRGLFVRVRGLELQKGIFNGE